MLAVPIILPAGRRPAFSLLELLVVIALIGLLVGILAPALSAGRSRGRATQCLGNLRSVGQAILSFASDNDDYTAPAVRERDYYWDRGEQTGWDISVGRWAGTEGGPGTMWQCPINERPYVGNTRALGLDTRAARPRRGRLFRAGPRMWYEPSRLVVAYDLQPNIAHILYPNASDPMVGDLSDELDGRWPRDTERPLVPASFGPYGPHDAGRFGVLFADAHVGEDNKMTSDAVIWSGRRWW